MKNFQADTYKQQYQYKSFSPSFINRDFEWQDWPFAYHLTAY